MKRFQPVFRALPVFLALGILTGCQQPNKALTAEDDTNPHFHAATADLQVRDFAGAAKEYEAALRDAPTVVQAHYELGVLYSDHLNDPIAAIYHFEQYLKLRPSADNVAQAQALFDNAKVNFAASLPNSPIQNAQAYTKLQGDNQSISRDLETANQKIADLTGQLASAQKDLAANSPNLQTTSGAPVQNTPVQDTPSAPAPAPVATPVTPPAGTELATPAPAPAAPAPAPEVSTAAPAPAPAAPAMAAPPAPAAAAKTYTIASGDTLWKISKKFYPGKVLDGIDKIKAANPDTLPPGKPLKIGTQIKIP